MHPGYIYIYSDLYDSAAFYAQKALDLSKSVKVKPDTEVSIYFSLYFIAKMQENYPLALYYHEIHEKLLYNIQSEIEMKNLYNIQQQYNYEALQNKLERTQQDKRRAAKVGQSRGCGERAVATDSSHNNRKSDSKKCFRFQKRMESVGLQNQQ